MAETQTQQGTVRQQVEGVDASSGQATVVLAYADVTPKSVHDVTLGAEPEPEPEPEGLRTFAASTPKKTAKKPKASDETAGETPTES